MSSQTIREAQGDSQSNMQAADTATSTQNHNSSPESLDQKDGENQQTTKRPGAPLKTTFSEQIDQYRAKLDTEFADYEKFVKEQGYRLQLDKLDWNDLQERYESEMTAKVAAEEQIMNEFATRFQQLMLWMQVSNQRETERALKRLRTRIAFVQGSESQLNRKHDQYNQVLQAFETAVAMLNNM